MNGRHAVERVGLRRQRNIVRCSHVVKRSPVESLIPSDLYSNWSSPNAQRVLHLLSLQAHESVLDLGCGSAEFTLAHIAPHCATVVGLDSSPELLAAAEKNLEADKTLTSQQKGDISFVLGDGHEASKVAPAETFDVVFSNAALHWMKKDPQAVVNEVYELLKPGGRFVAEFGGASSLPSVDKSSTKKRLQVS